MKTNKLYGDIYVRKPMYELVTPLSDFQQQAFIKAISGYNLYCPWHRRCGKTNVALQAMIWIANNNPDVKVSYIDCCTLPDIYSPILKEIMSLLECHCEYENFYPRNSSRETVGVISDITFIDNVEYISDKMVENIKDLWMSGNQIILLGILPESAKKIIGLDKFDEFEQIVQCDMGSVRWITEEDKNLILRDYHERKQA